MASRRGSRAREAAFCDREPGRGTADLLQRKALELDRTISHYKVAKRELEAFVAFEKTVEAMARELGESVVERTLDALTIGGLRMRGDYGKIGRRIGTVMKRFGRWAAGGPFTLYHEMEYRDQDADYEVCVPLRRVPPPQESGKGTGLQPAGGTWSVRTLPRRRCLVTLHHGPYEQIGRSYARLLRHARSVDAAVGLPIEEIYLRGPGMFVPRSPSRYLTEIRLALG